MSLRNPLLGTEWGDYFMTAGSRVGVLVFSFAANVIITRTIGAEGRGLYALVNNSILLAALLASIGAAEAVAYFVAREEGSRRKTVGNGLVIVAVGTVVVVTAGAALRTRLPGLLGGISPSTLALILACVLPAGLARVFRATLQGLKDFTSYNVCIVARPVTTLVYSCVFLLLLNRGMAVVPYMLLLVTLTECVINGGLALRHIHPDVIASTERIRKLMSYGLRANVTMLLNFVHLRIGIFLLGYLMTKEAVGIYSVSAALAEIQMYIPLAVGWVWMPRVATRSLDRSVSGTKKLMLRVLPVLLLISALLVILGPRFIPAVFGPEFTASYMPMLLLLPGGVLLGMVLIISGFFDGRGKPHLSAILSLCAVVVIVVSDIFLIPVLGIRGAALGSSLGYLCAFVVAVALFWRASHHRE
jgi:O-antigen/teichoic acid export membrane protein